MMLDTLHTQILSPFKTMGVEVSSYIPTLFYGLVVLFIGWIVIEKIRDFVVMLLSEIKFDKLSDHIGFTKFLKTGGIKKTPSTVLGCIFYAVSMIILFIITLGIFKISFATEMIITMFDYVHTAVVGVLMLIIGMYIARFVSVLIYIAAKNTDMPAPATLSRLTKLVIMISVTIMFLHHVKLLSIFAGDYSVLIQGLVFALALAFGLAGKDVATKYLDVFKKGHK